MDFITDLFISNSCDSIWVMVNLFTKIVYLIPLEIDEKKTNNLIRLFI